MACLICRHRKAKCDNVRPTCGPCSRFQRPCQYAERERKRGPKKRSLKQLEDRMLYFERKLTGGGLKVGEGEQPAGDPAASAPAQAAASLDASSQVDAPFEKASGVDGASSAPLYQLPWDGVALDDGHVGVFGPGLDLLSWDVDAQSSFLDTSDSFLDSSVDSMPSEEVIRALHKAFFERVYMYIPLIHKRRYLESEASNPLCLRYAIWALGAELSHPYQHFSDTYYRKARAHLDADEMKGAGESYLTLAHAQTWSLLATYETLKHYQVRAGFSCRRAAAMSVMLGLDRLDAPEPGTKRILPAPADALELEERRRTFWVSFCNDWGFASTNGWPLFTNSEDLETNLPASESAFSEGLAEKTPSLSEARKYGLPDDASPYAATMLVAQVVGENMLHLHRLRSRKDRPPESICDEHQQIDNALSKMFISLPEHLRVASAIHDQTTIHLNMALHASVISLHQGIMQMTGKDQLDPSTLVNSQNRCFIAASEIANMARMVAHVGPENMHLFATYPLFMAAHVFLNANADQFPEKRIYQNLEIIYATFRGLQNYHSSAEPLFRQLHLRLGRSRFASIVEGTSGRAATTLRDPAPEIQPQPDSGKPFEDMAELVSENG